MNNVDGGHSGHGGAKLFHLLHLLLKLLHLLVQLIEPILIKHGGRSLLRGFGLCRIGLRRLRLRGFGDLFFGFFDYCRLRLRRFFLFRYGRGGLLRAQQRIHGGVQDARQIEQLSDVGHVAAALPGADSLIADAQLFSQLGLGETGGAAQLRNARACFAHIKHIALLLIEKAVYVVFHGVILLCLMAQV